METSSSLRREENAALAALEIGGDVLDLGGDARSAYRRFFKAGSRVTTVNLGEAAHPDIVADLEEPLVGRGLDSRFDEVLLVNVLEHVYRADGLLRDAFAAARPGGRAVVVVPFLFPVHPSPYDFRRFTDAALRRMLSEAGFVQVEVQVLGAGVFSATTLNFERLMPSIFRVVLGPLWQAAARFLDRCLLGLARLLGKKYRLENYALGYLVSARKPDLSPVS